MTDDMDQDKEIPFVIPNTFKLAQTGPDPDESVFEVGEEVKSSVIKHLNVDWGPAPHSSTV